MFYKKAVLFNSECCEIFKSTYFEKYLRTAASENVFMKLRKIKNYPQGVLTLHLKKKQVFSTSVSEASENVCFYFMVGFP